MSVPYGTKFPQYLSMQLQVLWFETDDWFLILYMFLVASNFGGIYWLLVIPVPYLFIKAKRKGGKGFFKHLLYRCGFVSLKGYPSYFMRRFRE